MTDSLTRMITFHQSCVNFTKVLCAQIPKAQKDSQVISVFVFLGSPRVKVARKMLVKWTHGPLMKKVIKR